MKRDDMDIDEILKRYLPRAPQEEVEAAGEQVLERIRAMRFPSAPRKGSGSFGLLVSCPAGGGV